MLSLDGLREHDSICPGLISTCIVHSVCTQTRFTDRPRCHEQRLAQPRVPRKSHHRSGRQFAFAFFTGFGPEGFHLDHGFSCDGILWCDR